MLPENGLGLASPLKIPLFVHGDLRVLSAPHQWLAHRFGKKWFKCGFMRGEPGVLDFYRLGGGCYFCSADYNHICGTNIIITRRAKRFSLLVLDRSDERIKIADFGTSYFDRFRNLLENFGNLDYDIRVPDIRQTKNVSEALALSALPESKPLPDRCRPREDSDWWNEYMSCIKFADEDKTIRMRIALE
jgi:hypothetical protein